MSPCADDLLSSPSLRSEGNGSLKLELASTLRAFPIQIAHARTIAVSQVSPVSSCSCARRPSLVGALMPQPFSSLLNGRGVKSWGLS